MRAGWLAGLGGGETVWGRWEEGDGEVGTCAVGGERAIVLSLETGCRMGTCALVMGEGGGVPAVQMGVWYM